MNLQDQLLPVKEKLQKAIELELATIPPYLTALFSIVPGTNAMPSAIIRSIVMEEMLHMLLAGNLLSAIGGSVKLGKNEIPVYPVMMEFKGIIFEDRSFQIHLAGFSKDTIAVFLQIELPDGMVPLRKFEKMHIPGSTIGEFYDGIKEDLKKLCNDYGEDKVFIGKKEFQVSDEYYWRGGGSPIVVTKLSEAIAAIDLIVEQGEGASIDPSENQLFYSCKEDVPHYFRFNEIDHERLYAEGDDVHLPPTGNKMEVDYNKVYPIKTSCKSSDYANFPELNHLNNLFNTHYSTMLSQLEEGFNGNPSAFYSAILNGMHKLTPLAKTMVQISIPGDTLGRNAAPSFEWNQTD